MRNIGLTGLHWSQVISLDTIFKHFDICTSWLQSLESLYRVKLTQRRPATFLLKSPLRLAISFFCVCVEEAFFNCIVVDFLPEPALPLSSGGATGSPFPVCWTSVTRLLGARLVLLFCWLFSIAGLQRSRVYFVSLAGNPVLPRGQFKNDGALHSSRTSAYKKGKWIGKN